VDPIILWFGQMPRGMRHAPLGRRGKT